MTLISISALIFTFSACQKEIVQKNYNNTVSLNSGVKRFDGGGRCRGRLNLELGSVELDHEEIKGSMPAMIMEFYVTEKNELKALQIGFKVEFVLEEE